MPFHFPQNSSSMPYLAVPYKRKILNLLISSVESHIQKGNINSAESGLILILKVIGFLSTEVFGVFTNMSNCQINLF